MNKAEIAKVLAVASAIDARLGAADENAGNFLMKRHELDDLGGDKFYDWNANNVEDLRNRYFASLYPFKLQGEFKKFYDDEMKSARGQTQVTAQQVDLGFLDSLFGLIK